MIMAAIISGGCDMLGLSSTPARTSAPVEKPDPAAAGTTTATNTPSSKATASAAGARPAASRAARKRAPAAVTAVASPAVPTASTASSETSPEVAAADSVSSLESRVNAQSTTAAAPFVTGARAAGIDGRIYSQADEDVIPARLVKSPTSGPVFRNMASTVNTMELIISKQGRVEEVKLTTPAKKMTDMLLLSGAKTWKFVPATRNGQPVRYRTQFSWEETP
jgi:hypothetical protein